MIRRLLLWDVDGTLVRAGDIGAAVFESAFESVLGIKPKARIRMSGKTDPNIVVEYLEQLGVPESDGLVDAVLVRVAEDLAAAASAGVLASEGRACPGVAALLATVAQDATVVSTLLTGNIYLNALVKVGVFGLDKWLETDLGAYGSDARDRNDLVPIALARVAADRGVRVDPADVWVIGDTPRDLECAQAAGARCLLVGTGRYTTHELAPLGADAVLDDLADTRAVVKLLMGD